VTARRYSPDELFAIFRTIRTSVSDPAFFGRPEHKRTQELWCAAHFGRAYDRFLAPCSIWLDDSTTYTDTDFELEIAEGRFPFQVTEVQQPGRRRGDEYRQPEHLRPGHDDLSVGSQLGPQWVREGIEKKIAKNYADVRGLNLLAYLNFPASEQQYIELRSVCETAASHFGSVWLLNGNTMCVIHPNAALANFEGWMVIPESLWDDER
jgi:hypothetical protein